MNDIIKVIGGTIVGVGTSVATYMLLNSIYNPTEKPIKDMRDLVEQALELSMHETKL